MPANLYLRKVDHPQAVDNYRVILKDAATEIEIGSIGPQRTASVDLVWHWGIDTVIPMRAIESEGVGRDRKHCMERFRAAWQRFCSDEARLTEFLQIKRRSRRSPK